MTIRTKILTLSILTVLISAFVFTSFKIISINQTTAVSMVNTEKRLMDAKKLELKNYVDLAYSGAREILSMPSSDWKDEKLKEYLSLLRYGDDGYFFATTGDAVMKVHPKKDLLGKDLWDVKSESGILLFQELISSAKSGGDYVLYDWPKLNQDGKFMKLSYSMWLPEVNWMFGTGFYLDDITAALAVIELEKSELIKSTIIENLIIATVMSLVLITISLLIINRIIGSLTTISDRLKSIAEDGGDLTQRLEVKGKDELSELSNAFNLFVEKIHALVKSS
jgi:methyl-accepting chemotaxis protein